MQAPQSPIPDSLWKASMHIGAAGIIARFAYSLFTQASSAKAPASDLVERLRTLTLPEDKEQMESVLLDVLAMLDMEEKSKLGSAKNVLRANIPIFIDKTLRGVKESSILLRALKIVSHCCIKDASYRLEFARFGGVKVLITLLQNTHEASNLSLMEEIASTLKDCTHLQNDSIVLPSDVPQEAKGAAALLKISSLSSMLRTLDPNARHGFLSSMVAIFGNVCALRQGAVTIARGLDGKQGIEFFVPLLDHSHSPVVAAATRVVQSMIRHDMNSCREHFERGELIGKLIDLTDVRRDPAIVLPVLQIVYVSTKEKNILREFILRDGLDSLFTMWCTGNDPLLRDLAEKCIQMIEADPTWKGTVQKSREVYRTLIQRRAENDAKEKKQQMQAMQQQRMFQQMMMEQLGMSPEMMEGE